MTTDITNPSGKPTRQHLDERVVEAVRHIFHESTVEREDAGLSAPFNLYDQTDCSLGELKRVIGSHQKPPLSYASVHAIVTGQTHRNVPGPIASGKWAPRYAKVDEVPEKREDTRTVAVREVYRVGRVPAGQHGRQRASKRDNAVLVSRQAVRGTGERGHLVETVRLVEVDANGVIQSAGPSLKVEGDRIEGNRELTPGKVLDALCDPELVLDGQANGLPVDGPDSGAQS